MARVLQVAQWLRVRDVLDESMDGHWRLGMVCEARGDRAGAAAHYRQAYEMVKDVPQCDEEVKQDLLDGARRNEEKV